MSDRHARVNALFTEALDHPELERTALLDARCGEDAWLRAEVEELLRLAHTPAPAFDAWIAADAQWHASLFAAPHDDARPPIVSTSARVDLPEGHRLGAWRIGRRIGQGGMGTVFLAERADGQYEQRAALKLVHAYGAAEEIERRFARERRILASLNHPNVARLFDGGQADDGRLFFVMEYVEGLPIDRYCDERRATIDERLDLFVRVCAGVQHAHDQLVVHRDLKPSNIFVSDAGEVKLLDFGIARLLASAESEGDGDRRIGASGAASEPVTRVLTPEYASPEQFRGEHTAIASDVYQLGLLLYALLTGHHAQGAREIAAHGLAHVICERTPVKPSARAAEADDATCLARRTTRAAYARTLRGDLDQITLCALRKEPDQRYASVRDLADDVQRYRRRLPVRAAGGSLRYRLRKFASRHRAALAWSTAAVVVAGVAGFLLVGAQWRAAREADYAARVEDMVLDLVSLPTSGAQGPPSTVDYLNQATGMVRTQFARQPERQSRLFVQLGRSYSLLGHYQPAADLFREAVTLRESIHGAHHKDVAQALEWLGQTEHYQGHYDRAEASLRRASSIRRTAEGLAPEDAVVSLLELGYLLHSRGKLTEAESTLRQAVATLRRRSEAYGLARGLRDLGNVLRDRGAYDESAAAYRESIQVYRGLPYPVDPGRQAAMTEYHFGRLLIQRGALAEAEPVLASALAALRPLYEGGHPNTASAQRELAYLRIEQGRLAEAEALLTESVAVFERWLGADHPLVWRTRVHQADLVRRQGRHTDSIALAGRILGRLVRLDLSDHPSAIDLRLILGETLAAERRIAEATRVLSDGLSSAERQFVRDDARTRRFRQALASVGVERARVTDP